MLTRCSVAMLAFAGCTARVGDHDPADTTQGSEYGGSDDANETTVATDAVELPNECGTPDVCGSRCLSWEREYQGGGGVADHFAAVAIAPDATIIAAGMRDWTQSGQSGDLYVVGYSAAGDRLWELTPLGVDNGEQDEAAAIAVGLDGTIGVLAWRFPGLETSSVLVLIGDEPAAPHFVPVGNDVLGTAVMFASDGGVLVGGTRDISRGMSPGFLKHYSTAGVEIGNWSGDEIDLAHGFVSGIVQISENVIALSGASHAGNDSNVWVAMLDLEYGLLWSAIIANRESRQWASDLAVLPGGDLIVVGTQYAVDNTDIGWAGRFGPDASVRWTRTYESEKRFTAVETSSEGRVFVLGARGDQEYEIEVQELDCDGEIAWEWNYASTAWGFAYPGGLAWDEHVGLVVAGSDYLSTYDRRGYLARLAP